MSKMIGTRLDQVVKHRAAATGGDYVTALHEVVSEGGPLVRAYAAGELTPADLFSRLEKIVEAVADLMPSAGSGVTAGSASMLGGVAGEAQKLLSQLQALGKLEALPGFHRDAELAQLARKIDHLEQRLLGEARSVGARAAAPGSATLAYRPPSQAFAEPLPIRTPGVRNFGVVVLEDGRHG
jgi:hypothetical protein